MRSYMDNITNDYSLFWFQVKLEVMEVNSWENVKKTPGKCAVSPKVYLWATFRAFQTVCLRADNYFPSVGLRLSKYSNSLLARCKN